MNAKQINTTIKIEEFMALLGHYPAKRYHNYLMFKSPFRADDDTPSLKVSTERNQFIDFGTGQSGTLIDFVLILYPSYTVSDAIKHIENSVFNIQVEPMPASSFFQKQEIKQDMQHTATYEVIKTQPLQNKALLDYTSYRGIKPAIATKYLKEIYYKTSNGKNLFACGMQNSEQGWNLRNRYQKCVLGNNSYTLLRGRIENPWLLIVYEGMFDALSKIQMNEGTAIDYDILILNSTANISKITSLLKNYQAVNLQLDNDNAGRHASEVLMTFELPGQKIFSTAHTYAKYKDLNEFLINN